MLGALVVLVVGWLIAKLLKSTLAKGLKMIKLDALAEKAGIDSFLKRGNIEASSVEVLSTLIYWLLLLVTVLVGLKVMDIGPTDDILQSVAAVIPRVVIAVVVVILGLYFATFVSDVVQTAAVNAQIRQARVLANMSRYSIVVLALIIALEQLQIDMDMISHAILILFAAVCAAGALAFGLGCRDLARSIATDYWEREKAAAESLAAASADEGD
jgi:hypothetical protein